MKVWQYWLLLSLAPLATSVYQFIGLDGVARSDLQSYLNENSQGIKRMEVVLDGENRLKSLQSVFNWQSLGSNQPGVSLHVGDSKDSVTLVASFGNLYSTNFCGCKAAEFCSLISNDICILLDGKDLFSKTSFLEDLIRRISHIKIHPLSPLKIQLVVDCTSSSSLSSEAEQSFAASKLTEMVRSISKEFDTKIGDVIVDFVDGSEASYAAARNHLVYSNVESISAHLGDKLTQDWAKVPEGLPRPLLTLDQREAMVHMEAAFLASMDNIDKVTSPWILRVAGGKTVGKFGLRVDELLRSSLDFFRTESRDVLSLRERSLRAESIRQYLASIVSTLYQQQFISLQTKLTESFNKGLVSIYMSGGGGGGGGSGSSSSAEAAEPEPASGLSEAAVNKLLEKSIVDFRAKADDLEVSSMGLNYTSDMEIELRVALAQAVKDFPDSLHGRFAALKKTELQATRPVSGAGARRRGVHKTLKKSETDGVRGSGGRFSGPWSWIRSVTRRVGVSPALSIVAMLRPPGFGSLQGFVGYSTGLLGIPLELLLGVQNDGDSAEVLGEDREQPILRLQPKFHFEVDVKR